LDWIHDFNPDVIMMQEIKTEEKNFPFLEFEDEGYNVRVSGQKSYNGVAILSKFSIEDVIYHLPTMMHDPAERYMECVIDGWLRIINVYTPNGNPINSEKFSYKLEWMNALKHHIQELQKNDEALIIAGDFNAIRNDYDVYDLVACEDDAIVQPESRAALQALIDMGFTDAYRKFHADKKDTYSWWGYMAGMFQQNHGMLLDYFLLNDKAEKMLVDCDIDLIPRGKEKPSDHTPIWIKIKE
jgi:exodeoxyribonuclease-3